LHPQSQDDEVPKAAVTHHDVARLQRGQQAVEQTRFTLPERAGGAGQEHPAGQTEPHDQLHYGETTTSLLIGGLGKALLVGRRVRQPKAGTIHHLEGTTAQQGQGRRALHGGAGAGEQRLFQQGLRQVRPGLAVTSGVLIHGGPPCSAQSACT